MIRPTLKVSEQMSRSLGSDILGTQHYIFQLIQTHYFNTAFNDHHRLLVVLFNILTLYSTSEVWMGARRCQSKSRWYDIWYDEHNSRLQYSL